MNGLRLDGNSVLIIDGDPVQRKELAGLFSPTGAQTLTVGSLAEAFKALGAFDFDVVICSYYLPEGLIHHVIDWCRGHLKELPIFVALGSGMSGDEELLQRQLIAGVFQRGQHAALLKGVQGLLFDFREFYQALLSMDERSGINLELVMNAGKFRVGPIEMMEDRIFISSDVKFAVGTFALLRVSVYEDRYVENYVLAGSLGGRVQGGQYFKVNEAYFGMWEGLLSKLNDRQVKITGFLDKVAGK